MERRVDSASPPGSKSAYNGAAAKHDIELARAAVAALSWVGPEAAREFHTRSFNSFCSRYENRYPNDAGIRAMEMLGEVQRLPHGYWFPTPVRTVPLASRALVLAPIPTERIAREFRGVSVAGLGRVALINAVRDLPVQSLDSWLRTSGPENKVNRDASGGLVGGAFLSSDSRPSIEYLSVTASELRFAHWGTDFCRGMNLGGGVRLSRERTSPATYTYFFFKALDRGGYAESTLIGSIRAYQIAAAAAAGTPFRYRTEKMADGVRFSLGVPLPSAESRLVRAIAHQLALDGGGRQFTVNEAEAVLIEARFARLGLERKL